MLNAARSETRYESLDDVAITLTSSERAGVRRECARISATAAGRSLDSPALLFAAELLGGKLPESLLRVLSRFRIQGNGHGGLLIRNLPLDAEIPATPTAEDLAPDWHSLPASTLLQLAICSRLGDVISYADEKSGRLVQDIVPMKSAAQSQENSGTVHLDLHTEDGFHPYKPDLVTLLCLRPDHDRVASTLLGSIGPVVAALPADLRAALHEPWFRIRVSSSFRKHGSTGWSPWLPVARSDGSEFVLDFHAMEPRNEIARQALAEMERLQADSLSGAVLEAGDLLVIDNRTAVHGRTLFKARYNGTDRWLRRCLAVTDLRRSRTARFEGSRVCRPLSELTRAVLASR
ncbi:TauD/TfdA family dioxygenase [Nocardia sp. CA-128927]|uniref:TauD/TfdA family dioxygenase n=1 Tax=Nocardia sp. CA-128927 TaxID=3239975 RepID=UPI003D997F90